MIEIIRCKSGHEMTSENSYVRRGKTTECKSCRADGMRLSRKSYADFIGPPKPPPAKCTRGHALDARKNARLSYGVWVCLTCRRLRPGGNGSKITNSERYRGCTGILKDQEIIALKKAVIVDRRSLLSVSAPGPDRIISMERLQAFRHVFPELWRPIGLYANSNRDMNASARLRSRHQSSKFILRTNSWLDAEALPALQRATAKIQPFFMRDEINQELLAMLWAGEISIEEIPQAVRRARSQQYSNYDLLSKFGHRSLDAPVYGDSARSLGDTVADVDMWSPASSTGRIVSTRTWS